MASVRVRFPQEGAEFASEVPPSGTEPAGPASWASEPLPVSRIGAPEALPLPDLKELWHYRELLYFLAGRDVKVRYKQTLLGVSWALLQPAMMMVVFTIFFSRMAGVSSGGVPYPLFAYTGLLPWTFFAAAVAGAGNSVIGSERIITKVYFPRLAIPFSAVGAAAVDFVMAFVLLLAMMAYYGVRPGPGLVLMPLAFGLIALAGLGVGTLFAALNVAYRDVRYVIPFLIQLWMFATPAVYMQPGGVEGGQSRFAYLLAMNPLNALIGTFRASVLGGPIPWGELTTAAPAVVLGFVVGCLYFEYLEDRFADIL